MADNLFHKDLTSFQKTFNRRLKKFFASEQIKARKVSAEYAQLVGYLSAYLLAGGKRLRPFLLCRGRRIAGSKSSLQANQAGLALELFHNFALIHDDIMDGADLRRGQPTLHHRLEAWHRRKKWRGDSQEFGVGMAILAGDMLLVWADELINNLNQPVVTRLYQEMKREIMIGQAEDIFLSKINKNASRSRIINTALLKSARYSVARPLILGAAIAGREKKYQKTFNALAEPLGLVFQLQDDILGVFGKQTTVGKSVSGDIREGKLTLLMHYALKTKSIPQRLLKKTWGNESAASSDVKKLKAAINKSQAPTKMSQEISQQLEKAERIINQSPLIKSREKLIFLDLLTFLQTRDY